jgi:hypothetical protein
MCLRLAAEACQYGTDITLGGGGDTSSPPERLPAGLARKQQLREVEVMDAPPACPAQVTKKASNPAGGSFSAGGEEASPPPPHCSVTNNVQASTNKLQFICGTCG